MATEVARTVRRYVAHGAVVLSSMYAGLGVTGVLPRAVHSQTLELFAPARLPGREDAPSQSLKTLVLQLFADSGTVEAPRARPNALATAIARQFPNWRPRYRDQATAAMAAGAKDELVSSNAIVTDLNADGVSEAVVAGYDDTITGVDVAGMPAHGVTVLGIRWRGTDLVISLLHHSMESLGEERGENNGTYPEVLTLERLSFDGQKLNGKIPWVRFQHAECGNVGKQWTVRRNAWVASRSPCSYE